ncbi:DUF1990 family protein [Leucobacter sp. OH1287]|uniref:DUF1990 family protein n=1 Tax=Leucobacter sp. OH1287 TaxID=2491049 RepID=UPI000F5F1505|nr:DUF1990 family protein [Leucobacter sp. OH1287]RRD61830.1 DUF1990 family protein [Leucobacter sp. OH1287]
MRISRRKTFQQSPLGYAEVGASADPDLLRFPPNKAVVFEKRIKLGSSEERFVSVVSALMTWQAHKQADCFVSATPAATAAPNQEQLFSATGEPYAMIGDQVSLRVRKQTVNWKVLRAISAAQRAQLMLGSLADEPITGELLLSVHLREDGSVWGLTRGFVHPEWRLFAIGRSAQLKAIVATNLEVLEALRPTAAAASGEE